jgi:hypothetical protein
MITTLKYGEVGSVEGTLTNAKQFLTHDWSDHDAPSCGMPLDQKNFARFREWLDAKTMDENEQVLIIKFGCGLPDPTILFDYYLDPLAKREQRFSVYLLT